MPCRALEAFRRREPDPDLERDAVSLNALSGIGGVQTRHEAQTQESLVDFRLNALSGIGGVQTQSGCRPAARCRCVLMPCRALEAFRLCLPRAPIYPVLGGGLNALSGIGGVQTYGWYYADRVRDWFVLMPCRALEAFRRHCPPHPADHHFPS